MTQEQEQTPPPGAGRGLDAAVARKLGKHVVDDAWNCWIDPESGEIDPLSYKDPDFKEGYNGGIRHLYSPVYLGDYWPIVDMGDGKLGYDYGDGEIELVWPPQIDKENDFSPGPECHYLEAVPAYSTSWEAAMQIAEFVWEKNFTFKLKREKNAKWWECKIRNWLTFGWRREETGPMAICLSFLQLPDFEVKE